MKSVMCRFRPAKAACLLATAVLMAGAAVPSFAQDAAAEQRIRKVEAEIRALQRKVFPGGDKRFFEPEISASGSTAGTGPQQPSTTAVTDVLARMDALEAQIARLTGQIEQNTNRIAQLEAKAGIAAASSAVGATPSSATPAPAAAVPTATPAPQSNLDAMTGGASAAKPTPVPAPAIATAPKVAPPRQIG